MVFKKFLIFILLISCLFFTAQSDPGNIDRPDINATITTYMNNDTFFKNEQIKINCEIHNSGGGCGDWEADRDHAFIIKIPENFSIDESSISISSNSDTVTHILNGRELLIFLECGTDNEKFITNVSYILVYLTDMPCPFSLDLCDYVSFGTDIGDKFQANNLNIKLLNSAPKISNFAEKDKRKKAYLNDNLTFSFLISDNDSSKLNWTLFVDKNPIKELNTSEIVPIASQKKVSFEVNLSRFLPGERTIQAYVSDGENESWCASPWMIIVSHISVWDLSSTYIIAVLSLIIFICFNFFSIRRIGWKSHFIWILLVDLIMVILAHVLLSGDPQIIWVKSSEGLAILATISLVEVYLLKINSNDKSNNNKNIVAVISFIFLLIVALVSSGNFIYCISVTCIIQSIIPLFVYLHLIDV